MPMISLSLAFMYLPLFIFSPRIISNFMGFLFSATCFASLFVCCGCGMILFRLLVASLIYTFGAGILFVRAAAAVLSMKFTNFCPNY